MKKEIRNTIKLCVCVRTHAYVNLDILFSFCLLWDFPHYAVVKNPSANAGDIKDSSSIPGLGRSPGKEHGTLSSIFAWRIPQTEVWWATVHRVTKSRTWLSMHTVYGKTQPSLPSFSFAVFILVFLQLVVFFVFFFFFWLFGLRRGFSDTRGRITCHVEVTAYLQCAGSPLLPKKLPWASVAYMTTYITRLSSQRGRAGGFCLGSQRLQRCRLGPDSPLIPHLSNSLLSLPQSQFRVNLHPQLHHHLPFSWCLIFLPLLP